ncbi:MAG: hypothetical protein FJ202_02375 [Gemmatimonadetes bacterium]|nr:hypothetical protein [Gemmatimonadota bacterium]
MPDTPGTALTRDAIERVLGRAAELQSAREGSTGSELSETQLVELAREVGLSADAMRQAIAEERARLPIEEGVSLAKLLLGSAVLSAGRAVPLTAGRAFATLDDWMQRTESLQLKRRGMGQMSWEPKVDFVSAIRRTLRVGGRGFHLAQASEVIAVVADAGDGRAHARLAASLPDARGRHMTGAVVATVAGLLVGVPGWMIATEAGLPLAAALALVPAVGLPLGAFLIARRTFHRLRTRVHVALEQALDRLEYDGGGPRS